MYKQRGQAPGRIGRCLPHLLFVFVALICTMISTSAQTDRGPAPAAGAPFAVHAEEGRWWLTTPTGRRFFSSGICCVTPGETWQEYDSKKPAYAAWRQYPTSTAWADATLGRMKSWGFTTVGGWSDYALLKRSSQMDLPYTPVLHLGSSSGAPWWNMWDPKVVGDMETAARTQILAVRDDPRLLGYYTDNELGWWNVALFQMTLDQKPDSEQRKRLIRLLREQYHNEWSELKKDFLPEKAANFTALERSGKLYLQPGGQGMRLIRRFGGMLAERYYALVRQLVRKYDRRGLLLGDRYQAFYYPEVAHACRNYMDIVSTNLNPGWKDGSYPRYFLDTLYALAGRPVTVGEFYMTSTENRSGNKNSSSGFPVVPTQQQRASGFASTLTALAKTPYVVGADWFQYYDEPMFGRPDGENYNMGLVDIEDRPYVEITSVSATIQRDALHAAALTTRPDVGGGVPHAAQDPLAHWQPMEALQDWDRERGFVPPSTREPVADLYLCWNQDALYVGLYALNLTEESAYKDKRVPEIDRAEWVLRPAGSRHPLRIRLGSGRAPAVSGDPVEVVDLSRSSDGIHNIAAVRLPASLFGKQRLQPGDILSLEVTYESQARADYVAWSGKYRLSQ
ncbi:MAG TPA: hypothetical protein VKU00_32605 [Chthonomonadaceae bacterium]|nr:hypothetical protein [Chthonomonadaceae bacterium]